MYTLFLFAAAWTADIAFTVGNWKDRKNFETSSIAVLTACILGLSILITVDAITRSRAGLGLMIVAVAGACMLALADRRRSRRSSPTQISHWIVDIGSPPDRSIWSLSHI